MRERITVGAVAGLAAALLLELAMLERTVTGLDRQRLSALAVVAEAAHAHGALAGALIALAYGGVIGALFGWLTRRLRLTALSGLHWGVLYGLSWAIVSGLVVVPLLQGEVPFGAAALVLMAPALLGSWLGHALYGALLGVGCALITNHAIGPPAEEQQRPAEHGAV
jgi:hypothetical protein